MPPPSDDDDVFDRMIRCGRNVKYSRIKGTNLWATVDEALGNSHGGVYRKI